MQLLTPKAVSAAMAAWMMALRMVYQLTFLADFIRVGS